MNADDTDTDDLGAGMPRGGEGLATGSAPQEGTASPDPDATVQDTIRGGEGLATGSAPQEGEAEDDGEDLGAGSPRGGEGLADDAG